MQRALACGLFALVLVLPLPTAAPAGERTIVAVLDSGVYAQHAEFDAGQVIAWRDFINARPEPYDDNGHGTAAASLAAGNDRGACGATPKLSFAPGAPLVVAKVIRANGALPSADLLADALDWAVDQGAKVVSISIGTSVNALLTFDSAVFRLAVERAQQAGVVVVVSGGNGSGVDDIPWPSWDRHFANVPGVIAVGGARIGGDPVVGFDLQPDVTSWGWDVCAAETDGTYGLWSGTSFSTPLVAGMIAGARDAALANGAPADAARLELLVKTSARNSVGIPYAQEGLGFLLTDEFAAMRDAAAAGGVPDYGAQGPHATAELVAHEAAMPPLRSL